jgi:hypothetical protein
MIVALLVVCNRDMTSYCVSVNVFNKLKVLIRHYFIIRSSRTKNNNEMLRIPHFLHQRCQMAPEASFTPAPAMSQVYFQKL